MPDDREKLVAEVNRLYWDTDIPVTEMAEKLGISRRTIYDMLIPTAAHESCPECGGALVYPNRSARLSGEATCSVCGRQQDVTLLHEISAAADATGVAHEGAPGSPSAATLPAKRSESAVARRSRTALAAEAMPRRPSSVLAALLLGGALIAVVAALLAPGQRRGRWRR